MRQRHLATLGIVTVVVLGAAPAAPAAPAAAAGAGGKMAGGRPNVVLVIADDMCWRDCGCYGSAEVKTPNIDRLARQGMRFDACFTATAMCAPTRQQLYTGVFPVRNGAWPNHSKVYPGTRSFVHHFRALGYRVGLIGKTHVGPRESFPFEHLGNLTGRGDSATERIAAFAGRDTRQPYVLIVASHNPHGPYTEGPQDLYAPAKLTIPPYLVDTPATREGLAKYYAEITALDGQVGDCMKVVEESGRAENTIFLFTSEQGSSFSYGGKWTCYENGLKTCLIVRWPGKVKPGSVTGAMVQYVDIVPTLLEAAGAEPARIDTGRPGAPDGGTGFDGRSFLKVLAGRADAHRDYVFGVHTTRGIINGSECYPIRSVRSARLKYILNPNSKTEFSCVATRDLQRLGWDAVAEKDPKVAERVKAFVHRPAEELYDLAADPFEQHNLAGDPQYRQQKEPLRAELSAWMKQQGDRGNETEMKAAERQGRGKPPKKGGKDARGKPRAKSPKR